jgi:hypothetical protein
MTTTTRIRIFATTLLLVFVLSCALAVVGPSGITVGLVTKYVLTVEKKTVTEQWKQVGAGEPLVSGDQVKTGEKSLAIIKFKDNSFLRVREKTTVTVNGEITGKAFSKTVQLDEGSFGFNVRKQQNEKFIFRSPTSVASIRGTKGKMSHGPKGDTLHVYEGLVNFLSTLTNEEVDVAAGYVAILNPDGSITLRKMTDAELAEATETTEESLKQLENELKLELKDSQGKSKDLKIKFKK